MKVELKLIDTDSYARDTLARIKKNLGTDMIVVGSYVVLGQAQGRQVRLDLRVQETQAGETVASVSDTGPRRGSARAGVANRQPRARFIGDDRAVCRRVGRRARVGAVEHRGDPPLRAGARECTAWAMRSARAIS